MGGQVAFYFDSSACIGCKACQMACKDKNDLAVGRLFRRVYSYESGEWQQGEYGWKPSNLSAYFISLSCNHCEVPACVEACPTGASSKDPETGIVAIDQDVCIGCQSCILACPYAAPSYNEETKTAGKCDCCKDYVDQGKCPACVAICPLRCLDFGEFDELKRKYGEGNFEVAPLPPNTTNPSLVLIPHAGAQKSDASEGDVVSFPVELALD